MNIKQKITEYVKDNSKNFILSLLFLLILFLYAWLSDDAYITFRTVDNFVNGYGLTWNISERVQSFTHPLWTLVLSVFYLPTGEIYYTSLILSMVISLTAVLLIIYKLSDSYYNTLLIVLILILSKSFIDYSTSGLENPLTHLLIAVFFIVYFNYKDGDRKLLFLSLVASLVALNRLDAILICIPILISNYLQSKKIKGLLIIILGFVPLIIWEMFSLLYYGFLFTNTAYAKLNTGIAELQLIGQGINYFLYSIYFDPITPFIILIGLIYPIFLRDRKLLLISAGIFLYAVYIIYIGGDFMGGRFLSAPLLCSTIIISTIRVKSKKILALQVTFVIMIGMLASNPPSFPFLHTSAGAKIFKTLKININQHHGIVDERDIYFKNTGLINNINQRQLLKFCMIDSALMVRKSSKSVVVQGVIGMFGYYCGPKIHIIDTLALSDPLLSKLPCDRRALPFDDFHPFDSRRWRIGHFKRSVPVGYIQTIQTGANQIADPDLRKYYDKLHVLIKGDVGDINRLKEIWNFNIGRYNYLLKNYAVNLRRKII
ncbi:MAG TPA: hypothetical protein DHV28_01040 [Ignavibacteriales bacterium]|nr:hypothetical protein [Ignavibacteriales bacterium]